MVNWKTLECNLLMLFIFPLWIRLITFQIFFTWTKLALIPGYKHIFWGGSHWRSHFKWWKFIRLQMLRHCLILHKAYVLGPASWFCLDRWSCACLYYNTYFENIVYSCVFKQLGFSAKKSSVHMYFLCCLMWMT